MNDLYEINRIIEQLSSLQHTTSDANLKKVYQRLARKINKEVDQWNCQKRKAKNKTSNTCTSNLPYLSGVADTVLRSSKVQEVMCRIKQYSIVIDVICDGGKTWKKIVAKNAQSSHLVWASQGQYGSKDVTKTMLKYLAAATEHCDFASPSVVCVFCNGVTKEMAAYLESLGVTVEGERVDVSPQTLRRLEVLECFEESDEYDENDSDDDSDDEEALESEGENAEQIASCVNSDIIDKNSLVQKEQIFLDVTTMVVYVSDVCNGGADFDFKDPIMATQAKQEQEDPVMTHIFDCMRSRKLVTCDTAVKSFQKFVALLGGEKEKERANDLVKTLTVVPDQVSPKFEKLKLGGKIKPQAKTIFGTADYYKIEILTSNEAFVRAAAGQGIHTAAILTASRALSELAKAAELSEQTLSK